MDKSPSFYAIESALVVYIFAKSLGFKESHFDVRKQNISVWKFHERFGALKKSETAQDFLYRLSNLAMLNSINRYSRYLPHGIKIIE
jgi:hypothetical protein